MPLTRRGTTLLGSLVLSLIAHLFAACAETWPREPFTPEAWKEARWEQRYVYYESLAQSRLLDGANREGVEALLGKPDGRKYERMTYLVRKRPMGIGAWHEVKILEIRFDSGGIVERYFVRGT